MRIYLDVDEVVCDFLGGLAKDFPEIAREKQLDYALPDYVDFALLWNNPHFWLNLDVLDRPDFQVSGYVSHRPFPVSITETWLSMNNMPLAPVYHVQDSTDKYALLLSLDTYGDILFVDDKPQTFIDCYRFGVNVFLYDQPWNRHIHTDRRISSLAELKEK